MRELLVEIKDYIANEEKEKDSEFLGREVCELIAEGDMPEIYGKVLKEIYNPDTITLKRIYSTHCQVCGEPYIADNDAEPMKIVYFIPLDNNIVCTKCAIESGCPYEPRIYKEES